MRKTISKSYFINDMLSYHGGNGFTREGLSLLYDYLKKLEQSTGEEIEYDVESMHVQFNEMLVNEFIQEYYDDDDIDKIKEDLGVLDLNVISGFEFISYMNNNFNANIVAFFNDSIIFMPPRYKKNELTGSH